MDNPRNCRYRLLLLQGILCRSGQSGQNLPACLQLGNWKKYSSAKIIHKYRIITLHSNVYIIEYSVSILYTGRYTDTVSPRKRKFWGFIVTTEDIQQKHWNLFTTDGKPVYPQPGTWSWRAGHYNWQRRVGNKRCQTNSILERWIGELVKTVHFISTF